VKPVLPGTGTSMDLQKEEARLIHRPAAVPKFGGGNPKCARCGKSVFANEKVVAASKDWHEACLKCPDCNKVCSGW
jgi:hypothetical protein